MTKYFSIAAVGLTADQEKELAACWKSYGWWHGVTGFWIMRDVTNQKTAKVLRDEIRRIAPNSRIMVVEMGTPTTWAGGGMNDSNRDWLRKYFPPEGE